MMPTLISGATQLPLAHISIRVPWHDNGWNGTICQNPLNNTSCLRLKNIGMRRNDEVEASRAGANWAGLPPEQLPACASERGAFMAPAAYRRMVNHPYSRTSDTHKHFELTPFEETLFAELRKPTEQERAAKIRHAVTPLFAGIIDR
jgi:hypothetical protein